MARIHARMLATCTAAALLVGTVALPPATAGPGQPAGAGHGSGGNGHGSPGKGARDLGREVLPADDGWAAANGGTTGGAAADDAHVFTVRTWDELRAALGGSAARGDTTPRVIYVQGAIDAFAGADGARLTCDDFAGQVAVGSDPAAPFSMDDYIAAYDPAVWGRVDPSGPLEDARVAAAAVQAKQTQQHVGSHVTIVGLGKDARIVGANLRIRDSANVILRNLTFSDAYDCFPQWDPGDTDQGNWNSAYDNVSVWTSTNVWVANSTFDDGDHPASSLPTVYGRPYEVHDGLLDITHSSNYVTVSYNRFTGHDKTMLIGSSNNRPADVGTLKVTIHHNLWEGIGQRAPRVRYGQVHVYDNLYVVTGDDLYQYQWGPGTQSQLYLEDNVLRLGRGVELSSVLTNWGATQLTEKGTLVNGRPASALDAFLAAGGAPFAGPAGWEPVHVADKDPVRSVERIVQKEAGAGRVVSKAPASPKPGHPGRG
ncbi:pectate lyase [Cellulomonas cellasea]|uniref:pectate lyase family protein n=1 Tax=Cellulomonas cellasea TaxID=43670 RepID=UPI0025A48D52|nr:pectate lyase [Cellulomonas cellasea]MDM8084346.1 pectate lyase [Cellulomonas cellasea]